MPNRFLVGAIGSLGMLAACSPSSAPNAGVSNGSSGASGGSAGGSIVNIGGAQNVAGSGSGAAAIGDDWPADLAPPWLYDDGTGFAYKDPNLADDAASRFGAAATGDGAPEVVYPVAGAMFPRNLLDVVFQWHGAGNGLFRLEVQAPDQTYRLYFSCAQAECAINMPKSEWFDLGRRYAGQALTFTLSGTDGQGGPVATAPAFTLSFSPEPVLGALYYWAAGTSELKRASFGSPQPVAFIKPDSPSSEFPCVSCHSVSRDGKVIAFAVAEHEAQHGSAIRVAPTADPDNPYVRPVEGPSPWASLAADYDGWAKVTDDDPPQYLGPTQYLGNLVGLNADGTLAAVNGFMLKGTGGLFRMFFEIRDARSGATLQQFDYPYLASAGAGTGVPIMPEWSPDGSAIAVTLADNEVMEGCIWSWNTCKGSIGVFSVENGRIVGTPRVVVPFDEATGLGHFYPTWSPDGQYLAFASAAGESFNNPKTVLRLVRAQGGPYTCPGPDCWELTAGTRYAAADAATVQGHSTWPKFTPFAQGANKNLFFISFTSRLPYGFLTSGNSQLWMFAVDTERLASGGDPSYSPIWLPFQDPTDLSLTPYWTEELPCQSDAAGGCTGCVTGEVCEVDSTNHCQCVASVVK